MKKQSLGILAIISTIGIVTGCGSARDVALTGTVTADSAVSSGPVRLEFYEHQDSSAKTDNAQPVSDLKFVNAVPLDALGKYSQTVPVEGDKIHVVAFIDANKDEKCTDGEAWGETEAAVQSDNTAKADLNITAQNKCPALPASSN